MSETLVSREQAETIARSGRKRLTGHVDDMRLDGDPPVWILIATEDRWSESPSLAQITIRVRRSILIDALTGKVLAQDLVGNPEYIPDPNQPSRFVSQTWRHQLPGPDRVHNVLIYSIQVYGSDRFAFLRRRFLSPAVGFEALVDGEWAAPSGYMSYLTYDDAMEAARSAVQTE